VTPCQEAEEMLTLNKVMCKLNNKVIKAQLKFNDAQKGVRGTI